MQRNGLLMSSLIQKEIEREKVGDSFISFLSLPILVSLIPCPNPTLSGAKVREVGRKVGSSLGTMMLRRER